MSQRLMTVVRCPYCVLDDEFRAMVARLGGRFVCNKCGHSAVPSEQGFHMLVPEVLRATGT
jgi:transposase-like protein